MILYPAIDLYEGKAVRLLRGRYEDMTVYSTDPAAVAEDFAACGAEAIHAVDLEGARDGEVRNFDYVLAIKKRSGLFTEIGGATPRFCAGPWSCAKSVWRSASIWRAERSRCAAGRRSPARTAFPSARNWLRSASAR